MRTESDLKRELKKRLRQTKLIRIHPNSASAFTERGWPDWDIIIYYPDLGSKTLRAELKAAKKPLSPNQYALHARLVREKIPTVVIRHLGGKDIEFEVYDGDFHLQYNLKENPMRIVNWAYKLLTNERFTGC